MSEVHSVVFFSYLHFSPLFTISSFLFCFLLFLIAFFLLYLCFRFHLYLSLMHILLRKYGRTDRDVDKDALVPIHKNLCPTKLTGNRKVSLKFVNTEVATMSSIMQPVHVQPIGILNWKTRVFSFFLIIRLCFVAISLSCCRYFLVMSLVGITSTYPSCYSLSVKHCFFFQKS